MQWLSRLYVGQPFHIFLVGSALLGGYAILRFRRYGHGRRTRPLLVAALAWWVGALWEWLVVLLTPEANIRVDLLLIWPLLALLTAYGLWRLR